MTDKLADLIARLERATGADRDLDEAIAEWRFQDDMATKRTSKWGPVPRYYTASLDAALTLVPEGLDWLICSRRRNFQDGYYVHIMNGDVNRDGRSVSVAWHPIPAIALCIAALKARSATP